MKYRLSLLSLTFSLIALTFQTSTGQTTIFFEDFESAVDTTYQDTTYGLWGISTWDYTTADSGNGRLRTNAGIGFSNSGTKAVTMDVTSTYSQNYLILNQDMSSYTVADTIWLNFAYVSHGDESDPTDIVEVRGSNMDTWQTAYDLMPGSTTSGQYNEVTGINISQVLAAAGQSYSTTFQIRFGQYDNFSANDSTGTDGISFDDIRIFIPPPNDVGVNLFTAPAQQVGRQYTSISLDSNENVTVQVENFGASDQSNIPVYYQINSNPPIKDTIPFLASGQNMSFTFSQTANLFPAGDYTFKAWTELTADSDSSNDTSNSFSVRQIQNDPWTIPYVEFFHVTQTDTYQVDKIGLPDLHEWDFSNSIPSGRLRIHDKPGFFLSSQYAATMDVGPMGGTSDNYLQLTLNLKNYSAAIDTNLMLFFSYMSHGEEADFEDVVEIRGSDTDTWIQVYDLGANIDSHGYYKSVDSINISNFLLANAQDYSSSFQVRFGQSDNNSADTTTGIDGFSFDDIAIATSSTPLGDENINKLNHSSNVSIYPNPSDGFVTLEMEQSHQQSLDIKVYNITGELVKEMHFATTDKHFKTSLDWSQLSSGLYFIQLTNQEGVQTQKFIKK